MAYRQDDVDSLDVVVTCMVPISIIASAFVDIVCQRGISHQVSDVDIGRHKPAEQAFVRASVSSKW